MHPERYASREGWRVTCDGGLEGEAVHTRPVGPAERSLELVPAGSGDRGPIDLRGVVPSRDHRVEPIGDGASR